MTELPWDWSDFNSLSDNGIIEFDENQFQNLNTSHKNSGGKS